MPRAASHGGFRAAFLLCVAAAILPRAVPAQSGVYAYPMAGQTPQQEQQDNFECRDWAVQRTGFDPNRAQAYAAPPPAAAPPPQSSGFLGADGMGKVVR